MCLFGIGPRAVKNLKRRPSRAALPSTNRPYSSTRELSNQAIGGSLGRVGVRGVPNRVEEEKWLLRCTYPRTLGTWPGSS